MSYEFVQETEKKVRIHEESMMDSAISEEHPPLTMLLEVVAHGGAMSENTDIRKASIEILTLLQRYPQMGELLNAGYLLTHPFGNGIEGAKLFASRTARFREDTETFHKACFGINCAGSY